MIILSRKHFFSWLLPLGIALLLFTLGRPVFAELVERETLLSTFLSSQNVEVGVLRDDNGNPQIYYDFNGQQTVITTEDIPHASPVTDGKYIAWMSLLGQYWQIFLYHIPTDITVQLTEGRANNVNPKIDNGKIVWEGQVDGVWQIFLYDGGQIKQLTRGDQPSLNADLEGDYLVYTTKQDFGKWKSFAYDIANDEYISLTPSGFAKTPILKNGYVYWDDFDGRNRSVLGYNLSVRDRIRLSSGYFPAFGVRIDGDKVRWVEDIPQPPSVEEEQQAPEEAGSDTTATTTLESLPDPSPEVDLPPPPEPSEEEIVESPVPVSEEEVAEELGVEPEPVAPEPELEPEVQPAVEEPASEEPALPPAPEPPAPEPEPAPEPASESTPPSAGDG